MEPVFSGVMESRTLVGEELLPHVFQRIKNYLKQLHHEKLVKEYISQRAKLD